SGNEGSGSIQIGARLTTGRRFLPFSSFVPGPLRPLVGKPFGLLFSVLLVPGRFGLVIGSLFALLLRVLLLPAHGDAERVVEGRLLADLHGEQLVEPGRPGGAGEGAAGDHL